MFRFLFRNLKGYRFLVVLIVIMTIIVVESEIFAGLPLKYIPDRFTNCLDPGQFKDSTTGLITSSWASDLLNPFITPFDQFLAPPNQPNVIATKADLQACQASLKSKNLPFPQHTKIGVAIFSVLMLLVLSLLGAAVAFIQLYLVSFIAQNLTARLRKYLFAHLQRLTLDWHGKQKKGDLVQRVTGNIADIEKLVTDGSVDFIGALLTIVSAVVVMALVNWQFTLISVFVLPALILIVYGYTASIKRAAKKAAKAAGEVADVATEDVGAITVLKAFNLEEREARRFTQYVNKNREAGLRAGGLQAQFRPLVTILVAVGTAIILGIGAWVATGQNAFFIPAGTVTVGTLILFLGYLKQLYQPVKDFSKLTNVYSAAAAGAERIDEVLEQAPELTESKIPYNGPSRLKGDIAFENVFFGYTPEKLILNGINLHIAPGKKVALVGLSGGGKTTLVKLIPRFYEITQGSVKIDGVDNRQYPLSVLRQNVSMVLQESVLFEGTVLENLKIARPEATMDEIIDAAQQAQIHETIMNWPEGYATLVRNQGKNFSGGQRQRMAIARAILSRAPILVLDEPTASLDVEAEAEVLHALDKLVLGRTVLMISHRLSTLGQVDEIIVLKDGRIVERGNYKDLRRAGGVFAGLLKEQNRYNVEDVGKSIVASRFDIAGDYGLRQVPPPAPRTPITPLPPQPVGYQQHWPAPAGNGAGATPPTPGRGYAQNGGQQKQALRPEKARVLVEIDGRVLSEQPLTKPILTIGRLSSNDIPVLVDRVSRLHARIRWENGTWLIEDADSLNGISYQGTRVDRHVFTNGDRITLAPRAVLHFKAG